MWLMPLRSLSNCDYELNFYLRLILGPIHSNQVMGTDPVGSYDGPGIPGRIPSIRPIRINRTTKNTTAAQHMCPQSKTINQGLDSDPGGNRLGSARPSPR